MDSSPRKRSRNLVGMAWRIGRWCAVCTWMTVSFGTGLAGCHSAPVLSPAELAGEHLYTVRCSHCHEDNDLALKKAPPNLRGIFERKTLPSGAPATDAEVRRVILTGKGMMPAFSGRFSEEQMSNLVAYLKTGLR